VGRAYDNLDRLTSEMTGTNSVTYTYDAAGRRGSMTASNQAQVTYSYDDADRLLTVIQGSASVQFAYDAANRRASLTLPNGIVRSYGYDDASQLTSIAYTLGSTTGGDLAYTYDAGADSSEAGPPFQFMPGQCSGHAGRGGAVMHVPRTTRCALG